MVAPKHNGVFAKEASCPRLVPKIRGIQGEEEQGGYCARTGIK
jgi:hypothetical protein